MKHINALYTVDKNYFPLMLVSLYSMLEHNPNIEFDIHLIVDGLDDKDLEHLDLATFQFKNFKYHLYDFEPIKRLIEKYNMPKWNNSAMANARLFFDGYIDVDGNLLYQDSDTIITGSLEGLFDYTGTVNMVKDPMIPRSHWKELDPSLNAYYNSGFIWTDLQKWHENNCQDKIIEQLEKRADYPFPDQDIINKALKDDINTLPLNYNVFSIIHYFPLLVLLKFLIDRKICDYPIRELISAKRNPIINHCTPVYKWKGWDKNSLHPCRDMYANYFAKIGISPPLCDETEMIVNELAYKVIQDCKILCPQIIKTPIKKLIIAKNTWSDSLKKY